MTIWYPDRQTEGQLSRLLRLPVFILLLPFSLVYAIISLTIQYATQISQRLGFGYRAPVPVIVVGNFTVGGTGKTPLVAYLCEQLRSKGFSPGIISRGYGRTRRSTQSVMAQSTPREVGDEALWLHLRTQCPVVVAPRKNDAIRYLLKTFPGTTAIISDDGLQHAALQPDLRIAVIDGSRGLGNGWCLPAGPLRAPQGIGRFGRADICLVNGETLKIKPISFRRLEPHSDSPQDNSIEQFKRRYANQTIHAVAGIGNPARFFDMLTHMGLTLKTHSFPDHHPFTPIDLTFDTPGPIVMTEKDAIKCTPWLKNLKRDCWVLAIQATIEERFLERIIQTVEGRKTYVG